MNNWPLPKFNFIVTSGSLGEWSFSVITGLATEVGPVDYRVGDSSEFSVVKMPGMNKSANVTLKRGVADNAELFNEWMKGIRSGVVKRETVTITLLDESRNPAMVWELQNAWPTKITAPELNSDGNEIAIEELELCHEGFRMSNG